jgi:hypothetical protein
MMGLLKMMTKTKIQTMKEEVEDESDDDDEA